MAHRFAFINSEGELKGITSPADDDQYVNLEKYGDNTAVIIPAEIDNDELMVLGWYDTDTDQWKDRTECPSLYHLWQDKQWTFNSDNFFEIVREQRDQKLFESDWTQMSDAPITDAKRAEWVTYRQVLRDIPATYSDATAMDAITFPAKPE